MPLLPIKSIRRGALQLPTASVIRAVAEAKTWSVEIEEIPSETLLFRDPKVPSRKVAVRTPQGALTFATYDPADFPAITPLELTHTVEIQAWRLRRLLARTHFAADNHATRNTPGGSAFEFRDGALHCIVTDGRCLAQAFEDATGTGLIAPPARVVAGKEDAPEAIVPIRAIRALAGILDAKEYPTLTLGFAAPEAKFQVRTRGLFFVTRLLAAGELPSWEEVFRETPKTAVRVMDPGRFRQLLEETTRAAPRKSPVTELRLRRHVLSIVVANDGARIARELVVRNLSEAPDEEASLVVDPRPVLEYLAAETRPFVLSFPPREGRPLLCQSEGFRFALMPLPHAGR